MGSGWAGSVVLHAPAVQAVERVRSAFFVPHPSLYRTCVEEGLRSRVDLHTCVWLLLVSVLSLSSRGCVLMACSGVAPPGGNYRSSFRSPLFSDRRYGTGLIHLPLSPSLLSACCPPVYPVSSSSPQGVRWSPRTRCRGTRKRSISPPAP